jgi:hypothetical protein
MTFEACVHKEEPILDDDKYSIDLKWNKAYEIQTKQLAQIGFVWALSFLGADLPKGSIDEAIVWENNIMQVDFYKLGFNSAGLEALSKLLYLFKQSEEYKKTGAIDLGRFIALTLNSSNHYYAITGVANNFSQFKEGKKFDAKQFAATNSKISLHDRIIDLPDSTNLNYLEDAYVANECDRKIKDGAYRITSFEVLEQMQNGQLRFAIYDTTGVILAAAKGPAGKPANCLWCHEINIQPLFFEQIDEPGFYGADEFNKIVATKTTKLEAYRNTLKSDLDFTRKQDHTYTELLYISFMEPSAERLALEWGITLESVNEKLKGIPTHIHHEFGYLGNLYYRDEIEVFAPFSSIRPPSSARNKSQYEPDLIKN